LGEAWQKGQRVPEGSIAAEHQVRRAHGEEPLTRQTRLLGSSLLAVNDSRRRWWWWWWRWSSEPSEQRRLHVRGCCAESQRSWKELAGAGHRCCLLNLL
jgi:hypothetical protein